MHAVTQDAFWLNIFVDVEETLHGKNKQESRAVARKGGSYSYHSIQFAMAPLIRSTGDATPFRLQFPDFRNCSISVLL